MAIETDRSATARPYAGADRAAAADIDVGLRQYMLRVYNYMASGLALSGVVAMLVANNASLMNLFFQQSASGRVSYSGLGLIAVFAPIGLILAMSFGASRMKIGTLQALYWAFVATMGVSLASVLLLYTGVSVARVFFITAISFGGLSLYGYLTKRDLSGMSTFLMMGLIGLVVASLVNMFLQSTGMQFVMSAVGVLLFAGLTAYDTQRIKNGYFAVGGGTMAGHSAVMGAVTLYLDFINLFQFLLYFMGGRRN
ncbi:MAG: Bax inhibitor-1/YccA family protein [Rhodospirillaceae bacterium]